MRLAMESHTGGMPLCGLGAPETERVGATRSHDCRGRPILWDPPPNGLMQLRGTRSPLDVQA